MKRRKTIPLNAKLIASLRRLGLKIEQVEFHHDPPLALREWDEVAQDTIPPANDPEYIFLVTIDEHRIKTNGKPHTSYGSDKHAIAKSKRLENERNGKPKTKAKANKKEIKSRGFDKTLRKRMDGTVERRVT